MINSVYCHILVLMNKGRVYDARMYTAIEAGKKEKEYWRKLDSITAGIAMRKLQRATGAKPEVRYNPFDSHLTTREIVYYRER